MKIIDQLDVESYLRNLVSEEFGKQLKKAAGSTEQLGESDLSTPPLAPDQSKAGKYYNQNGAGS